MNDEMNKLKGRREFLKSGTRNIFLGALLVTAGVFGWRKFGRTDETNSAQQNSQEVLSPCNGCPKVSGCCDHKAGSLKEKKNKTKISECCSAAREK